MSSSTTPVVFVVLFWGGHWQLAFYIWWSCISVFKMIYFFVSTTTMHGTEIHQSHIQHKLGEWNELSYWYIMCMLHHLASPIKLSWQLVSFRNEMADLFCVSLFVGTSLVRNRPALTCSSAAASSVGPKKPTTCIYAGSLHAATRLLWWYVLMWCKIYVYFLHVINWKSAQLIWICGWCVLSQHQ